ncbi:FAD-dependent oxidoreductase [Streptomyces dioscori]|uniref:FAD-dependent oxidoreductase n=1 Tax=Streptomyces dioscori TaxID=2109333 RepID=A0A2P8QAG5_9ACTN|nr:NAD(P)/FAD-dependent oxidoreductase [Streptomyces dioscori]PSM43261.1 FAD-dependent oxidoreductase [Streptomyces dioscori]
MQSVIVIGAGQSGIAAAAALRRADLRPLVLEASEHPGGSWPHYYDSLVLFTPARFNGLPGFPFPGDPHHFPTRDETAHYLRACAASLDCEIHTGTRVTAVTRDEDGMYMVRAQTAAGRTAEFVAPAVVSATGAFSNPRVPRLPALDHYTGHLMHSADYHGPARFAGQRVVVVGAGNSAVQIATELGPYARVTLASRSRIRFATRSAVSGASPVWQGLAIAARLPVGPLFAPGSDVTAVFAEPAALAMSGADQRAMFRSTYGAEMRWPDGSTEDVDTVILATGYRPALAHLRPMGVLRADGTPRQRRGLSRDHPGLAFVGLRHQRTLFSDTLHGVGGDAEYLALRLAAVHGPVGSTV